MHSEWSLLLSNPPPTSVIRGAHESASDIIQLILNSEYEKVLCPPSSSPVKNFFHHDYTTQERETLANLGNEIRWESHSHLIILFFIACTSTDFEEFVRLRIESFTSQSTPESHQIWLLCVGIACLNSFVQHSWTGPDLSYSAINLFASDAFLPNMVRPFFFCLSCDNSIFLA